MAGGDVRRVRVVVLAKALELARTAESEVARASALRLAAEMCGTIGRGAKVLDHGEQEEASRMSPAAIRRELQALGSDPDRKQ